MVKTFYDEMERIIKQQSDNALEMALHYYGLSLSLKRQQKDDIYSKVHAKNAGNDLYFVKTFVGIIKADDFASTDGIYAAEFDEGFLYTKETDILVGDVISVDSGQGVPRFRIEKQENVGFSSTMFIKFTISHIT
jgi:hypothetical protein